MADESAPTIASPHLILVEGDDEFRFMRVLARKRALPDAQYFSYKGKDKLPQFLRLLTKLPNFEAVEAIGVVRDADSDRKGSFDSVVSSLKNVGLRVSGAELVRSDGKPATTILLLPGSGMTGALEESLLESVAGDNRLPAIDFCMSEVERLQSAILTEKSKAKVRTYMAVQNPSYDLISVSANAEVWPTNHSAFDCLEQLVRITVNG